jgi:hypothetical protein
MKSAKHGKNSYRGVNALRGKLPFRQASASDRFEDHLSGWQMVIFQRFTQFDLLHLASRAQGNGVNKNDIVGNLPFGGLAFEKRQ